ncbi:hypothetical protein JG688_00002668 [Phytophthora aleatoria]|nr:hypothetical protein GQ600_4877 [Phytophthora cactorum]KAG6975174.1 hypothetical protein JG688_00002668 [Phytophthora aleatoria]
MGSNLEIGPSHWCSALANAENLPPESAQVWTIPKRASDQTSPALEQERAPTRCKQDSRRPAGSSDRLRGICAAPRTSNAQQLKVTDKSRVMLRYTSERTHLRVRLSRTITRVCRSASPVK